MSNEADHIARRKAEQATEAARQAANRSQEYALQEREKVQYETVNEVNAIMSLLASKKYPGVEEITVPSRTPPGRWPRRRSPQGDRRCGAWKIYSYKSLGRYNEEYVSWVWLLSDGTIYNLPETEGGEMYPQSPAETASHWLLVELGHFRRSIENGRLG